MSSPARKRVLFLCTGNSCRSQMAEALVNARWNDRWEAHSAGTHPAGFVHPMVLRALEEIGIHHEGTSKSVDAVREMPFDLVVTVCDSAAEECPVWLGQGIRIHHGYPDPFGTIGDDETVLAAYRKLRDEMAAELPYLLERHGTPTME
jgi:arsenate reductase (thioredoxin)